MLLLLLSLDPLIRDPNGIYASSVKDRYVKYDLAMHIFGGMEKLVQLKIHAT